MIGVHVCQKLHDMACVPLFTILHTSTLVPQLSAYRLASPPNPTATFLRRYAAILNSQKQHANRDSEASPQASGHAVALAGALHFCFWVAGFLKKRWTETELRAKIVALGVINLPWISCEAARLGPCQDLAEGEVMMVCSRVRRALSVQPNARRPEAHVSVSPLSHV